MASPSKTEVPPMKATPPTLSKDPFVTEILEEVKGVAEVICESEGETFLGIPLKEKSEDEKRLIRFKEFLNTKWGLPAVVVLFRSLFAGGYPPIPVLNRWHIPNNIDITRLVWEQVQTENFIDEIWPSLMMMLGDDITNFEWAARIASVLSLFNIIRVLPIVLEGME